MNRTRTLIDIQITEAFNEAFCWYRMEGLAIDGLIKNDGLFWSVYELTQLSRDLR